MNHIERTKKDQQGHRAVGGAICIDGKMALCYYKCFDAICNLMADGMCTWDDRRECEPDDTGRCSGCFMIDARAAMDWNRKCWEDVDKRIAKMEAEAKTEVERLRAENARLRLEAK